MLSVAIAGAGVTGLATAFAFARYGHKVDVYERKTEEVFANEGGAGIQLQPNAMHILDAWGVNISAVGHVSGGVVIRRYDSGEPLGVFEPAVGYQVFVLRSDFRRAMLSQALAQGVKIHFGIDIVDIDASKPSLVLKDGVEIRPDLIIGADGHRSKIRQSLFPSVKLEVQPECTYQMQVPFGALHSDAIKKTINDPIASITLGPGTYIVTSPVPSRTTLDLQFFQADAGGAEDPDRYYTFIPDMTHLRERYRGFGGIIPEALSWAKEAWEWRITECSAPSWASENGRVVLGGDAVHAMRPASGQGAGMCIEDAAVLGELFRNVSSNDGKKIEALAKIYQQLRKPRTDRCHERAEYMQTSFTLPDGKTQQKRDAALRHAGKKKASLPLRGDSEAHPMSHDFDNWLEQYDAIKEARDALRRAGWSDVAAKL
ncbi:hypothetical protein H2200_001572 [Cladophialophora chaetospira]|uniref:FAD-binding domain-containing protein n=1 Tax=Cladophialophora chaetospira TaxID=386627 RepID=A0AA38XL53_9EURO|nr:hypothetical protein H2200_001572 [Cladophialophora chaetospira]